MRAFGQRIAHLGPIEHALDDANGFGFLILLDENARRRDAALAGIDEHAGHCWRQNRREIGARQDEVRGFSAKFLMDALDGIGSSLGHKDASAG